MARWVRGAWWTIVSALRPGKGGQQIDRTEYVLMEAADADEMLRLLRGVEERGLKALPAIRAFLAARTSEGKL